ncbi:hypothetical protein I3842_06G152900 [Carya illinoinensis]|uniref:Retrotransposon Copia-like N-terminal domain-containing protein n=1 Tax=Carya illinoinensis TaxID=32201 RepID=A0A922EUL0_CARIL|nr:hypothetical protein I3842_06G152900 [Carya illinoinensis]
MTMALSMKNKLEFVDGSILKPSDPNNPLLSVWLCYNNMKNEGDQESQLLLFPLLTHMHLLLRVEITPFSKKEQLMYNHCGIISHVIEKCYKLHRFPPGYKPKPRQQSMANQT